MLVVVETAVVVVVVVVAVSLPDAQAASARAADTRTANAPDAVVCTTPSSHDRRCGTDRGTPNGHIGSVPGMKRLVRFAVLASLLAAAAAAVRALRREQDPLPTTPDGPVGDPWPPLRNPSPVPPKPASEPRTTAPRNAAPDRAAPKKAAPKKAAPADRDTPDDAVVPEPGGMPVSSEGDGAPSAATRATPWVEPAPDGTCPAGHPVKAKVSSKIFHSPGQLNYDRTTPDRCYISAEAAEADGFRAAKR